MLTQAVEHTPFVLLESSGGHGHVAMETGHKPVVQFGAGVFVARVAKLISASGVVGASHTATRGGAHSGGN